LKNFFIILFGFDLSEADRANAGLHKTIWNPKCYKRGMVLLNLSKLETTLVSLFKCCLRVHRSCCSYHHLRFDSTTYTNNIWCCM